MKKLLVAFTFVLFAFNANAASPAASNSPPACTSKSVGIVQCMAGRMCECTYQRASAMKGTPERFGWDCGINRPNCMDNNVTTAPTPYEGPASVGYGTSTSNTTLNNSPSTSTTATQQQQSPTSTQTQTQTGTQTNTQN